MIEFLDALATYYEKRLVALSFLSVCSSVLSSLYYMFVSAFCIFPIPATCPAHLLQNKLTFCRVNRVTLILHMCSKRHLKTLHRPFTFDCIYSRNAVEQPRLRIHWFLRGIANRLCLVNSKCKHNKLTQRCTEGHMLCDEDK